MSKDKRVKTTLADNGDGHFAVDGELTYESVGDLLDRGQRAFEDHSRVVVDLAKVADSDSAGLALLLEWVTWANHTVREIHFVNIPQRIVNIASISEVDEMLNAAERWRGFL
ncbi:MAG: lipid asymmetry maintenance protein MlaB [Woeseiaceae bacterium]